MGGARKAAGAETGAHPVVRGEGFKEGGFALIHVGDKTVSAEFAANAILSYDELVRALKEALNQMDTHQMEHRERWSNEKTNMLSAARLIARKALARATGETP